MNIGIILGSTRKGRLGERVAKWAVSRLQLQEGVEAQLVDLADYSLPFYEQAEQPFQITGDYQSPVANQWRDTINGLDGFIIVNPEYNHGYSAVLKNALDYLYYPWVDKPVLFISYSNGVIGGARAVEQLQEVILHLGMVRSGALHIGKAQEVFSEAGEVLAGPFDQLLDKQLEPLLEWTEILNQKRAKKDR